MPANINQEKSCEQNGAQSSTQKQVNLALYSIIDMGNVKACLFLVHIVLNQLPCNRVAQCCLAGLERHANLFPSFVFPIMRRQHKDTIYSVPELRYRT